MAQKAVSIGILAWNEEDVIARTIESVFEQSLFSADNPMAREIEVLCVPNGCKDQTATVARKAFDACLERCAHPRVTCRVCEVEEPGKSNAWNRLIHDFANQAADYMFVLDSDIWFTEPETFARMVAALEETPAAHFAMDLPVKDIAFKPQKTFIERVSLGVSGASEAGPGAICGQFYCGRGEFIRRIWMPKGLTTEDSFLTIMAKTDLHMSPAREDRILRVPGASHVFEAYTTFSSIFKHYKACTIGSTVNYLVEEHVSRERGSEDAGAYIKRRSEENPDWSAQLVRERFGGNGWWVIPHPLSLRRFRRLRGLPLGAKLTHFPFALAAFLMDVIVTVSANQTVKKANSAYFWEKTRD